MTMRGAAMPSSAIRAYLVELRKLRRLTQQRVADEIGVGVLSWKKYEAGKTEDPSSSFLIAAIRAMGASFDHLRKLSAPDADEGLGRRLAELRVEEEQALDELEAMRATMSDAEIDALLAARERDLEEELNRLRGRRGGAGR
jgi:transcriptional regulator with XRE-family HTH domain